jgi:hypothetical protein
LPGLLNSAKPVEQYSQTGRANPLDQIKTDPIFPGITQLLFSTGS